MARKCLTRHDYDQVIQIAERIPEDKRNAGLQTLLEKARSKADEISFLLCDIDEAVRLEQFQTALKKAEALLKIKPGHHRALEIQQQFGGEGDGGVARLGPKEITQAWSEGGWVPWSALAFGLAVVGVVCGLIIIWLGKTAIVIDAEIPGITVEVKGLEAYITVPGEKSIKVEPGDQEIKVSYAGLETQTRKFKLKKGQTQLLTVGILNSQLVARLENEVAGSLPGAEKKQVAIAGPGNGPGTQKVAAPSGPKPSLLAAPFAEPAAQQARQKWADYLRQPGEITNTIGMKFLLIPPGEFLMGTAADRYGAAPEKPQHQVRITHPFYLDSHEVTRGEFAKFVSTTGYKTDAEREGGRAGVFDSKGSLHEVRDATWKNPGFEQSDSHPVVIVSWNDATAFCRWLSEQEGQTYRLPTEAEWEYACRAGTTTAYSSGGVLYDLFAVGNGLGEEFREHFHLKPSGEKEKRPNDGYVFTAPVGSFRPNQFGLFDMHGNAWEWCQDWFSPTYYASAPTTDPTGPTQSSKRVSRGGGFDCGLSARSATRDSSEPAMRLANLGFRVVRATGDVGAETTPTPVQPPVAATASVASADRFVPLFNGRDLTGWKTHPSQPGNWRVENGVLIGSGTQQGQPYISERSHLYTERGDFKDFHLRVEARINDGGNSGLYFRSTFGPARPNDHPKFPYGYEAQIDSTVDPARTGSLYAGGTVVVELADTLVPPGEWFTEEVIAQGNRFTIKVNGQVTAVYRDEKEISASGSIALQQNNRKTVAEFRKIEIKQLPPPVLAEGAPSHDGFVPLFNGKDLSGWARDPLQPGEWRVKDGILSGGGPSAPSTLYSERADYRDFQLHAEARLTGDASGGLCFRTEMPPPESALRKPTSGFEVELTEPQNRNAPRTGSVYGLGSGGPDGQTHTGFKYSQPIVEEGKWFTIEVIAEGLHTVVVINGQTTLDNHWVKQNFRVGRIALQQQLGNPSVEFRKIEIKELVAPKSAAIVHAKPAKDALNAPFDESEAQAGQQHWSDRLGAPVELRNSLGMQLRLIPPGQFQMGVNNSSVESKPAHKVQITRAFYLGTYEVTRGQFAKFVAANRTGKSAGGKTGWRLNNDVDKVIKWEPKRRFTWQAPGFAQDSDHPVVDVSWDDAREFCAWLSQSEGQTYRLPTEAEWEYACRAGTTTARYNGDNIADMTQIGNFPDATAKAKFSEWRATSASDGFVYTSPVGRFRPNSFGLYDTLGNVLEWCSDWYDKDYYKTSPDADPPGALSGKTHSARGGSFTFLANASDRWHYKADHSAPDVGFRIVREIPNVPAAAESAAAAAPAAGGTRHVWVGRTRFDRIKPGKWRETFPNEPGHASHSFDEIAQTPNYVQLLDRTRIRSKGGVSVRLEENQALMRWGGPDQEFKLLEAGHWETTDQAPVDGTKSTAKSSNDRRAAESVLALGGTVMIRQDQKDQRIEAGIALPVRPFRLIRVKLADKPEVSDAALKPLRGLTDLVELNLSKAAGVTDAGLESIQDLRALKALLLDGTQVSDAGLPNLDQLTQLEFLSLAETRVTDAGFVHLRGLTRLETLWINKTSVGDAGLENLRGLTELRSLLLWSTNVTDAGLVHLEPLRRLETLMLPGKYVSDAGLVHLEPLTQLKTLWLTEASVTDAGLVHLQGLSQLRELVLRGSKVTDAGLTHLQGLTNLKKLGMENTKVTKAGAETLKKSLPNCRILISGSAK